MASLIVNGAADATVPTTQIQPKAAIAREKKRAFIPSPNFAPSPEACVSALAARNRFN
jgi:hypothetical protein